MLVDLLSSIALINSSHLYAAFSLINVNNDYINVNNDYINGYIHTYDDRDVNYVTAVTWQSSSSQRSQSIASQYAPGSFPKLAYE